jgi:penicillin-binding protein 2
MYQGVLDGGSVDLAMSQSTIDVLRESMLQVVEGPQGTGRVVRLPRRQVAGKTGTAQNPHGDDHASFICFAPFDDPEIAVSVMLENAGHGSAEAAPLAKEILSYYFTGTGDEEVAAIR